MSRRKKKTPRIHHFSCPREKGFSRTGWVCMNLQERGSKAATNQRREALSRETGHPVWPLFEMTWPPPPSDRIDFIYLILFFHLLWSCPLRHAHTSATGLSPTSTSPKSAFCNLCSAACNTLSESVRPCGLPPSLSPCPLLVLCYKIKNTIQHQS